MRTVVAVIFALLAVGVVASATALGTLVVNPYIPSVDDAAPWVVQMMLAGAMAPETVLEWLWPTDPWFSAMVILGGGFLLLSLVVLVGRREGRRRLIGRVTFAGLYCFGQAIVASLAVWGLVWVANSQSSGWLYAAFIAGALIAFYLVSELLGTVEETVLGSD